MQVPVRGLDLHPVDTMSMSSGAGETWISSYCATVGHEYFAEVSEDFIDDDFNLTGLQTQVAMYKEALEVSISNSPSPWFPRPLFPSFQTPPFPSLLPKNLRDFLASNQLNRPAVNP